MCGCAVSKRHVGPHPGPGGPFIQWIDLLECIGDIASLSDLAHGNRNLCSLAAALQHVTGKPAPLVTKPDVQLRSDVIQVGQRRPAKLAEGIGQGSRIAARERVLDCAKVSGNALRARFDEFPVRAEQTGAAEIAKLIKCLAEARLGLFLGAVAPKKVRQLRSRHGAFGHGDDREERACFPRLGCQVLTRLPDEPQGTEQRKRRLARP